MKARLALVLVGVISFVVSCECPVFSCCGTPPSIIMVQLWVHDGEGRSLLDPATPGYFHRDSVELFTLEDGQLTPQTTYDIYRHYPVMIDTGRVDGKVYAGVHARADFNSGFPQTTTTVVKWSDIDSDTIEFDMVRKCNDALLRGVRFNGDAVNGERVDVPK